MSANTLAYSSSSVEASPISRLVRAWLITAVSDAIFSSVLVTVFYGSTFARLWQGVASVPIGAKALDGGMRTVIVGLLLHFCVALTWTTVFFVTWKSSQALRRLVSSMGGVIAAACVYGPCIWLIMSFVVIQSFTHRPPAINFRWWVQLIGHIPFVAFPMIATIGRWRISPASRYR